MINLTYNNDKINTLQRRIRTLATQQERLSKKLKQTIQNELNNSSLIVLNDELCTFFISKNFNSIIEIYKPDDRRITDITENGKTHYNSTHNSLYRNIYKLLINDIDDDCLTWIGKFDVTLNS